MERSGERDPAGRRDDERPGAPERRGPEGSDAGEGGPHSGNGGEEAVRRFHRRLVARGAEVRELHGRPALMRFDDLASEYGRILDAAAVLDETDRGLIRVSGPRAREMMNGLLSNELSPLDRGRGVYAFALTPKGRPVADLRVLPAPEGLWLDLPAAALEGFLAHLGRYLPPLYARYALREGRRRLGLVGPGAAEALGRALPGSEPGEAPLATARAEPPEASAGSEEEGDGEEGSGDGSILVVRREAVEGGGFDLYVPTRRLEALWDRLAGAAAAGGGGPAGRAAWEVRRVELGIPAYGAEIDEDVLAPETGQAGRAISYEKGCYTGQEVVARIHYRGHVNRHLRGIRPLEERGQEPLRSGDPLFRDERAVGELRSVVRSPRLGPLALAYVRREVEPGETLARRPGGRAAARVVRLPFVKM